MLRYKNNAFRVLGLTPEASFSDIMRRVDEIKVRHSVGADVSFPHDFAWMGAVDRSEESVTEALQRLENPSLRLKEELNWFLFVSDADKRAFEFLKEGKRKEAHEAWRDDASGYAPMSNHKLSALWNQAVLMHSTLLEKETRLKYSFVEKTETKKIAAKKKMVCPKCKGLYDEIYRLCGTCLVPLQPRVEQEAVQIKANLELTDAHWTNWRFVLNRFTAINSEEAFWKHIFSKAEKVNDPRLNINKMKEMQSQFLESVLSPNFFFISQALNSKDYERVKKHSNLINGINLPASVLKRGINKLLTNHISRVTECVEKAKTDLNKFGETAKEDEIAFLYTSLMGQIGGSMEAAKMVDINLMSDFVLTRDNVSNLLRNISTTINNRFKNYELAEEIIDKAVECAGSSYQKQRLTKDAETVKANAKAQRANEAYQSYNQPKNNNNGTFWGWAIFIGIIFLVNVFSSSSKNSSSGSSKSNSVYRPASSASYSARSGLKSQIESLKGTIQLQENKVAAFQRVLKNKSDEIENLRSNMLFMSSSEHNKNIDRFNSMVNEYNQLLEQARSLQSQYQSNIERHNNLVEQYNGRR